jgi:hypothetical protein
VSCWRVRAGLQACGEDDSVILALPDIRQRTPHGCGIAALETVWSCLGVRTRHVPDNPIDGMSPDTLENALWNSGLALQAGSMDLDDLKYHTRRGRPVVCCVQHPDGDGHWVVVAGVAYGFVKYQCPASGPQKVPAAVFATRWTDQTRRGALYSRWGIAVGV